jgi:hypothetical protein
VVPAVRAQPAGAAPRRGGWVALLARQFTDPIVLILLFAVLVAVVAGT